MVKKNIACNSLDNFLNLDIFTKYGSILLFIVFGIIIIKLFKIDISNLFDNKNNNKKNISYSNNQIIEESFVSNQFPGLYYLKNSDDYIRIKPDGSFIKSKSLIPEIKNNPYLMIKESGDAKCKIPIYKDEYTDLFNNAETNIGTEIIKIDTNELMFTFDKKNVSSNDKSKLVYNHITPSSIKTSSIKKTFYITLDNTIGKISFDNNDSDDEFTIVHHKSALNEIFQPIIQDSLKIDIHPKLNQIKIDFNIDPIAKDIDHFLIVLAKYDYQRKLIGHLKVHTSQEQENDKNICVMDMGMKKCHYTLTDIDHIDQNGNVLYYRLGVIPIRVDGKTGNYLEPVYPGGYTHFVMAKTNKEMDMVINKIKQMEMNELEKEKLHQEIVSEAGGEYDFLKKQLGGYPNALIYDLDKNTLNDLVDESMALGEINLNVSNV